MSYREYQKAGYTGTWKEYRLAYQRWKCALKRGRTATLDYFLSNPRAQFVKAKSRRYRAAKRILDLALATPKWVDREAICNFYDSCPRGMSVDHIVPINGKNICGLHVPWNLQYLHPTLNALKGNRYGKKFDMSEQKIARIVEKLIKSGNY